MGLSPVSKFNKPSTPTAATSPIRSERTPSGTTYEGAPGYARDAKSELFLLAVSNMVAEDTFYETANDRDNRFTELVSKVAVEDSTWLGNFLLWLRDEANMRTAPMVAALEAVRARLAAGEHTWNRQMIHMVLKRPDEPGEALAYWTSKYGKAIPMPIKRGIADAALRMYNERSLLRYDTASYAFRFGDVIDLTHPKPTATWQHDLFRHALDRRHNRDAAIPNTLSMLRTHAQLMETPVEQRREYLFNPGTFALAGMSWESLAGWLQGPMDAAAWQAIIPTMGYMALLRNLRNFDEAGVHDAIAEQICKRISDPMAVRKSRQLPMRFLSAYRNAPSLRWGYALETALQHSLANVPELDGRTLILVDRSGSMGGRLSKRSDLSRADAAAIFGTALALRSESALLVQFGTNSAPIGYRRGDALLRVIDKFHSMGGTRTAAAVQQWYAGQDRVVIVTDEQAHNSFGYFREERGDPASYVPANVPVYTWNLAGYEYGHGPSGANRHTFGGLSDRSFSMIGLVEAGKNAHWPWENQ